jgi:hypothetical protein
MLHIQTLDDVPVLPTDVVRVVYGQADIQQIVNCFDLDHDG